MKDKSYKRTLLKFSKVLKISVLAYKFLNTTSNSILSDAWSPFLLRSSKYNFLVRSPGGTPKYWESKLYFI